MAASAVHPRARQAGRRRGTGATDGADQRELAPGDDRRWVMSTTTHVSPVSGVPPRLAELAKGLGKRLRCLVSSPPSRTVSLANLLANTFLKLRLSGSSRPAHPRNHAGLMIPSRPGRRPAGPDRKRGRREGRRFYRPPQLMSLYGLWPAVTLPGSIDDDVASHVCPTRRESGL